MTKEDIVWVTAYTAYLVGVALKAEEMGDPIFDVMDGEANFASDVADRTLRIYRISSVRT